jgi:endonuclease YncB( thermonuclease family)
MSALPSKTETSPSRCGGIVAFCTLVTVSSAIGQNLSDPDKAYLSRYAGSHAHVAVVEYLDPAGARVEGQRTFTSDKPFMAGQGATIPLQGLTLRLFGIEACPTDRVIEVAVYQGPCSGALTEYLNGELKAAPIILCRAFATEQAKPVQDATCWNRYRLGPVDLVNHTESALLETGAARLVRNDRGEPLRPELEPAEAKARAKGSIIWNPRAGVPPPASPPKAP